jgi:hypothetical protein
MPSPALYILENHLAHNHYPPIPTRLAPVAKAAIEACDEGDPTRLIPMPEGFSADAVPAIEAVEYMHLFDLLETNPLDDIWGEQA